MGAYNPGFICRRPHSFHFTPFRMNSSTLPIERPSTQDATSLTIPWPERRTQCTQMHLSHLFWMSRRCHRSSGRCRLSGAPKRFTGFTEGRGSSLFSPPISPSLQSVSAIGPAHDTSHFCIRSYLFRSAPPPSFPLFPPHPDHTDRLPLWLGLSWVHKAPHSCPLRMVTHQAKLAMVHRVYGWVQCDSRWMRRWDG
jgi:hypothetical protein